MSRHRVILALALLAAPATISRAYAAKLDTPEERLKYANKNGAQDALQTKFNCKDVTLQFQRTDLDNGSPYDLYLASGCNAQTEYVVMVAKQKVNGYVIMDWRASIGAPAPEFEAQATSQLQSTAAFDLACKEGVQFSILHAVETSLHSTYTATIGATGCGKQLTYATMCGIQGVKDGKVNIACMNTANGAPTPH